MEMTKCADDANLGKMPHDAVAYAHHVKLHNYVNAFYQVNDVLPFAPRRLLLVGVGTGIETILLRHKHSISVTTLDIDPGFEPDRIGSVLNMHMFQPHEFDVAIISHVLEHLPSHCLERSVAEVARVAKNAIIYLPTIGRPFRLTFLDGLFGRTHRITLFFPSLRWTFRKPPQDKAILCRGEHYWEVGCRGTGISDLLAIYLKYFNTVRHYRNPDWLYSTNFILYDSRFEA